MHYFTTRYLRCVTRGESITLVTSNSTASSVSMRSNSRTPPPSSTGARWICNSSSIPASMNCRTMAAPPDIWMSYLACGCSCLLQGALYALGDEREGRPALPVPGFPRLVGEDEHRGAERRRIRPAHLSLVEHPSAHHVGSGPSEPLLGYLVVLVGLAALEALALAPALDVVHPLLDPVTSVAYSVVRTSVRSGDEPVERLTHVHVHLSHNLSLRDAMRAAYPLTKRVHLPNGLDTALL